MISTQKAMSAAARLPFNSTQISTAVKIAAERNTRMQPSAVCTYIRNAVGHSASIDPESTRRLLFKGDMKSPEAKTVFNIGLACLEAGGKLPVEGSGFQLAVLLARESNSFVDSGSTVRSSWQIDESLAREIVERMGIYTPENIAEEPSAAIALPAPEEPISQVPLKGPRQEISYFPGCPIKTRMFRRHGELNLVEVEPDKDPSVGEEKRFDVFLSGKNYGTFSVRRVGGVVTRHYVNILFNDRIGHYSWAEHGTVAADLTRIFMEHAKLLYRDYIEKKKTPV